MGKATNGRAEPSDGTQVLALVDTLRDTIAALYGSANEMRKIAAGQRTEPGELVEYYRGKAAEAQARLSALEGGEDAPPVSDKDWYCNECGHANVVHEAEVYWNRQWGCMEVVNMTGDRHCVECMQEQVFPENRGEPVFGVKPDAVRPAA